MIRKTTGLIALVAALAALPALATQVIQRTPQQLAEESTLIVDGTVTGVRSYWNESRTKILTEATVSVAATHKGAGTGAVRIVQLGGVVGNIRQTAHGAVQWTRGEQVLLFLEPSVPGAYQVAGFSQGKFAVERDPRTGRTYVQGATSASESATSAAPGRAGKQTLDQFLNQVLIQD